MKIENSSQSPNFGMALKIKPETLKNVSKESAEIIEKLTDDLAGTKVHLNIGKDLSPQIELPDGKVLLPPFKITEPQSEYLKYSATLKGNKNEELRSVIKFESKEAAQAAYKKISSAADELEKSAQLTKMLDKDSIPGTKNKMAAKKKLSILDAIDGFFNVLDWM